MKDFTNKVAAITGAGSGMGGSFPSGKADGTEPSASLRSSWRSRTCHIRAVGDDCGMAVA